jgi:hypothetical protein
VARRNSSLGSPSTQPGNRAEDTYQDAYAVLHEAMKIQEHLLGQDKMLTALVTKMQAEAS